MIRDRGTKKWTAMMLSEHLEEIRKWKDEDHYEERPELDDFDLQSIQTELEVAYKRKCQTLIKTWADGSFSTRGGIIEVLDLRSESIVLDNPFGPERIPVSNIVSVQCAE